MSETTSALYQALLGSSQTLDEALTDASKRIAKIGQRNTNVVRRVVRQDGMSSVKIYDLPEVKIRVTR